MLGRSFLAQKWAKWVFSGPKMLFWHKKPRRPYLENETSHRTSAGVKTTGFFRAFQIFRRNGFFGFLYFWIPGFLSGFLAISQERKELPEICGCQNDRIFEGFSDFQKYRIFGFLNFCISAFLAPTGALKIIMHIFIQFLVSCSRHL